MALAMAALVAPLPAWAQEPERVRSLARYVGRTELEIRRRLGRPSSIEGGEWIYRRPLGPGMHSFQSETVIRFANGRVVDAFEREVAIGCVIVE